MNKKYSYLVCFLHRLSLEQCIYIFGYSKYSSILLKYLKSWIFRLDQSFNILSVFMTIGGAAHANQTHAGVHSEDSANAAGLKASQRYVWTSYSPSNSYSTHYITNMSFHFSLQNENIVAPPQTEKCDIYHCNPGTTSMLLHDHIFNCKRRRTGNRTVWEPAANRTICH